MFGIKRINPCDVFVALWGLYYLQGLLYPQGIINQLIQLLMILMGLISFVKCLMMPTPELIKATVVLVLMYVVYGTAIILFGDGIAWTVDSTYLKSSFNSLLPITFFYIHTKDRLLNVNRIKIYTLMMTAVVILHYWHFGATLATDLGLEEITNNIGYMFLGLIPLVYFFNQKPLLQYFIIGVLTLFIIMAMKRGAILIGVLAVSIFLINGLKEGNNVRRCFTLLLSILIIIGAICMVEYMMANSSYFMARVNQTIEGNSSNRDILYNSVWNAIWNERNLFYLLFGHGANSTVRFAGLFAHQDWLETMCNNGIFGVGILATFFIIFANTVIRSRRILPKHLFYSFITLFTITFAKTMFSMSIQNMDVYQGMLIGYFAYHTSKEGKYHLDN